MNTKFEIKYISSHWGVFSKKDISKEEIILQLRGDIINKPTKYSIQLSINQHIQAPNPIIDEFLHPSFHWIAINHSCEPNCYFDQNLNLRSLKNIKELQEISFNYNTTESELAYPFVCNCGSKNCYKKIRGFKYLTIEQKIEIKEMLSAHLEKDIEEVVIR